MKFIDIIKQNELLKLYLTDKDNIDIIVLSNITLNQIAPILEFEFRNSGLNVFVKIGEYDNILQTSEIIKDEIPIVFWELSNLKESFVFEIELYNDEKFNRYFEKTIQELNILFNSLKNKKLVIFNKFSHILFSNSILNKSNFEIFVNKINHFLIENLPKNFILVEIDKIIASLGIENVINFRNFYQSKSLYTIDFLKKYSFFISPAVLSLYGKSKKALILDCDNTLWNGIVGEDGIDGIQLSETNKKGIFFKEIQILAKYLFNKGIILGICSKNNENDVIEVFERRKDMILLSSDFIIKKINWTNKSSNIESIAKELNIGIDSIVFIDDSTFEIELIKEQLPQVYTLQVPEDLSLYPVKMLELTNLFYSSSISKEDLDRNRMYKEDKFRQDIKEKFDNLEEYLEKLEISIEFTNKDTDAKDRISQLTQKTNQFNLTTRRYSIADISNFFELDNFDIISINVSDKYGNTGLTGICIIEYNGVNATIDTFLMSCRILGRNIENVFLLEILEHINKKGFKYIYSTYIKTIKNLQTEYFYENNNFTIVETLDNTKKYRIDSSKYITFLNTYNYIKRIWKKK